MKIVIFAEVITPLGQFVRFKLYFSRMCVIPICKRILKLHISRMKYA